MSVFLKEIKNEIKVRLATYKERKKDLQKAVAEIPILDLQIIEAQAELDSIKLREPDNGN